MPLTDTAIRKAKPGAGTIKLSDGGGLQKTFIQSFVHPNIPTIRSFIAAPRNAEPPPLDARADGSGLSSASVPKSRRPRHDRS